MSTFSGDPRTVWISETGSDRRMRLIDEFHFTDGANKIWTAPAGAVVDGASIPKPLWSLIGSPYTGDYRRASIVHDIACVEAGGDSAARSAADRMFYRACRTGGCNIRESIILYIGVRIGAWWPGKLLDEEVSIRVRQTSVDRELVADFQTLCDTVLSKGETDVVEEVERRTNEAMNRLALARLKYFAAQQNFVAVFGEAS